MLPGLPGSGPGCPAPRLSIADPWSSSAPDRDLLLVVLDPGGHLLVKVSQSYQPRRQIMIVKFGNSWKESSPRGSHPAGLTTGRSFSMARSGSAHGPWRPLSV